MKADQPDQPDHHKRSPAWAALVVDILNTVEVRQLLADAGVAWLRDWSDGHFFRKSAGRPAAWVLAKALPVSHQTELAAVFEKPEHIEMLSRQIPEIFDRLGNIVHSAAHAIAQLPVDRKKELFSRLFRIDDADPTDGLLAVLSRTLGDIHADDPRFFSGVLSPWIEKWVANTDFGELKSILNTAGFDLETLLKQVSGVLFQYPAKLIALLSLIPDGVNLLLSLVHGVLENINALPPDILTDLFLNLIKRVDAVTLGQSINRINEAIRQFHTGSTLIGEMDAPQFTSDLKEKIKTSVSRIDPALAIKARNALIDGRETLISVLIDTACEHPDYLNLWLHQLAVKRNSNIRLLKQKFQVFEMLPEEEADEALAAGLSSWNAYDLADLVNTLGRTLNRLYRIKPNLFPDLVSEFVNSLDMYELEETIECASRDLGQVIRPVFRMVAPSIIHELCNFFEPGDEDDGYDDAMSQARDRLRHLLLGKEASK